MGSRLVFMNVAMASLPWTILTTNQLCHHQCYIYFVAMAERPWTIGQNAKKDSLSSHGLPALHLVSPLKNEGGSFTRRTGDAMDNPDQNSLVSLPMLHFIPSHGLPARRNDHRYDLSQVCGGSREALCNEYSLHPDRN